MAKQAGAGLGGVPFAFIAKGPLGSNVAPARVSPFVEPGWCVQGSCNQVK